MDFHSIYTLYLVTGVEPLGFPAALRRAFAPQHRSIVITYNV
jgi:hypothetical protein